ncbi:DUF2442 domain-containing protein [Candidatus Electronema sp. JC]|uniref:DUF2442 domain-containing protein n=1 Tax=Candidatus Electronema sp. JC TaxID=3401570 RepID=UPI003B433AC9
MSSLAIEMQDVRAKNVFVSEDSLQIDLADGRTIIAPLMWYPRLWHGTPAERNMCQIIGDGAYIHWPELDEDLTVLGVLAGYRSAECPESLKKWLTERADPVETH